MEYYFKEEESIYSKFKSNTKEVNKKIIERYIQDNKETPYKYFLYSKNNYRITEDYLEDLKLHEIFPDMKNESYVYAHAMLNSQSGGKTQLRLSVYGPTFLYLNGTLVFRSNSYGERFPDHVEGISLDLKQGDNSLVFLCIKTPLGCGIRIGSNSYKGRRIQFFAPTKERKGMGGFIYSEPITKPLDFIPTLFSSEKETNIKWFPEINYTKEEETFSPTKRIFNSEKGKFLVYTKLNKNTSDILNGTTNGVVTIYTKKQSEQKFTKQVLESPFSLNLPSEKENRDIFIFGENININAENIVCPVQLENEDFINDKKLKFLYAGPFSTLDEKDLLKYTELRHPLKTEIGEDFWYVDKKNCRIRPYNEGVLFGEWSYPLGVTLYGLLKAGQLYNDKAIIEYVGNHLKKSIGYYEYCIWDKKEYGASPFLHQVMTLDCLDDCGSFASAMLEYKKTYPLDDGEVIATDIGEFIKTKQHRLPDGTFYRDNSYFSIMDKTIWADDMYMSIPFLCRYYKKTNDESVLTDIIHQVKRFMHYLYIPELQIMSHIYDTHYNIQTKVPWGRGNGWVIFSITELLLILPKEHNDYKEILNIYTLLCEGFLKLQDHEGMWHQVLTMENSYPETSCTAMFIYSFAYGVINGWFNDSIKYKNSALKGFEALCKTSIDKNGNLLGVCRGSGYSFSKDYYANELSWNTNDTHGTGIVILAGVVVELMMKKSNNK